MDCQELATMMNFLFFWPLFGISSRPLTQRLTEMNKYYTNVRQHNLFIP